MRAPSPRQKRRGRNSNLLDRAERGDDRDANAPTRPDGDRTATATATAIDAPRPPPFPQATRAATTWTPARSRSRSPTSARVIAAPLHVAHDDDPSSGPPSGFRGDFDALGFDFQAHADAPSRDDEASWIPNWIEHDDDLTFVEVAPAGADDPRSVSRERDHSGDHSQAAATTRATARATPTASPAGRRLDAEETRRMRAAMRRNPRYPALLDAYFACRCVGANDVGVAAANARKRQLLAEAETAAGATDGIISRGDSGPNWTIS